MQEGEAQPMLAKVPVDLKWSVKVLKDSGLHAPLTAHALSRILSLSLRADIPQEDFPREWLEQLPPVR